MGRLLRLQPFDFHPQSHHQQPASGPLTLDMAANDTLGSVAPPFHRQRTLGEGTARSYRARVVTGLSIPPA